MAGVYDGKNYRCYTSIQDFLHGILTPQASGMWYYAHAGGLADVQFILEWLLDNPGHGYQVSCAFSGSSAIIVRVSRGKYFWNFLDSFWLLRAKLRDIGKFMGLEKGGEEGSTELFYADIKTLIPYNQNDCFILYEAIRRLEDTVLGLGGRLEMTIASTAMSLFRRKYLTRDIHTSADVNDLASEAYIASRVEVFEHECANADYWDINSSFPYSMTFDAPGDLVSTSKHWKDNDLIKIIRANISVKDCDLPPLPYRTEEDRRIYFPTGDWSGWFSEVDLRLLESTGHRINRIDKVLSFEPFHDLKSYSEDIYAKRLDASNRGDDAEKEILKYLLNSLYGKFAEGEEKSKYLVNPPKELFFNVPEYNPRKDEKPEGPYRSYINPGIWELVEKKDIPHRHVPIAMHITALSRRWLYEYMLRAEKVYYCDTDGLVVNGGDYVDSKELGKLKYEGSFQDAHFHAPKTYAYQKRLPEGFHGPLKHTIRAKGISRPLDENGDSRPLTYADYRQLLEHKELPIERFSRVKGLLKMKDPHVHDVRIEKTLRDIVNPKRFFPKDGSRSRPWNVAELAKL